MKYIFLTLCVINFGYSNTCDKAIITATKIAWNYTNGNATLTQVMNADAKVKRMCK